MAEFLKKWPQWSETDIMSLRDQFMIFDVNCDGLIDYKELSVAHVYFQQFFFKSTRTSSCVVFIPSIESLFRDRLLIEFHVLALPSNSADTSPI